jgi:hypothetical protein
VSVAANNEWPTDLLVEAEKAGDLYECSKLAPKIIYKVIF